MSIGMMILIIVSVLTLCGVMQRVLDRMYLTDRQALALTFAMLLGSFLPNVRIGALEVNVGGGMIPLGVCGYLLVRAGTIHEKLRALLGAILTAAGVLLLSMLMPAEAEEMPVDPMLLYGLAGGLLAFLLGRSRRGAFICGVLGVMLADAAAFAAARLSGTPVKLVIGSAGIADAAVVSGVLAVALCELVGECTERLLNRGSKNREGARQ